MRVQGFWSGPPLTPLHVACLRSFIEMGHQFELYSYDRLEVPEGVFLSDAASVVPADEVFLFHNSITGAGDIAPFADYFRLRLLYELGGWYCDVDTLCLSPRFPSGPRIWARQCPEFERDSVSNGQLFFEKHDPLVLTLVKRCEAIGRQPQRRESLGPILFTAVVKELNLAPDTGATTEMFYPIRWIEIFKLWLPEFRDEVARRLSGATFLPLYQSFPAYIGLDPRLLPPEGSYLSEVMQRLAPEYTGVRQPAGAVREATRRWFDANREWALDWLVSIQGPAVLTQLSL